MAASSQLLSLPFPKVVVSKQHVVTYWQVIKPIYGVEKEIKCKSQNF